jgi:hypothetical protein
LESRFDEGIDTSGGEREFPDFSKGGEVMKDDFEGE